MFVLFFIWCVSINHDFWMPINCRKISKKAFWYFQVWIFSSSCNQNAQIRAATMIKVLDLSFDAENSAISLQNLPSSADSVFWSTLLKRWKLFGLFLAVCIFSQEHQGFVFSFVVFLGSNSFSTRTSAAVRSAWSNQIAQFRIQPILILKIGSKIVYSNIEFLF